ncbi:hypothetical protein V6N11_077007 [Hibiscus sabdariffa]|uniref:Reverse transcriptase zinc-binding domain-containing protein n=1 Tax=Hibiscus sabdariffa TaxID=183260 RepID=A0ABR2TCE6_9ROSI
MTNVEQVRYGLLSGPCLSCGCYNKMILHILRDCPPVRSFWQSIIPQVDHEFFFGGSLEQWVVTYIKTLRAFGHNTPFLWQGRLLLCFVGRLVNGYVAIVSLWVSSLLFMQSFGVSLWAYRWLGLWGFSLVQMQSDSSVSISMILDPMAACSFSSPFHRISSLQNHPWLLPFLWVPREMNMVADGLSKLPSLLEFQLQTFDDIPELIRPLFTCDREGPPYNHRG